MPMIMQLGRVRFSSRLVHTNRRRNVMIGTQKKTVAHAYSRSVSQNSLRPCRAAIVRGESIVGYSTWIREGRSRCFVPAAPDRTSSSTYLVQIRVQCERRTHFVVALRT
jgi:hypothetical protein